MLFGVCTPSSNPALVTGTSYTCSGGTAARPARAASMVDSIMAAAAGPGPGRWYWPLFRSGRDLQDAHRRVERDRGGDTGALGAANDCIRSRASKREDAHA